MAKYGTKGKGGSYYSKYPRKKYFKKSLGRAKTFAKSLAVSKYLKTNMQNIKCSYHDSVYLQPGLNVYAFLRTVNDYTNMASFLAGSGEFVTRYPQYSYYKINGISFTFSRKWMDPISYGENGVSKGFTASTFNLGLEECSFNFYPAYASVAAIGVKVSNAEGSWKVSPYTWDKQRHYLPFPTNFSPGSNSNGYGTWNSCTAYASILGQLSLYNSGECCSTSNQGGVYIWDLEVEVYISFCNSNGA